MSNKDKIKAWFKEQSKATIIAIVVIAIALFILTS